MNHDSLNVAIAKECGWQTFQVFDGEIKLASPCGRIAGSDWDPSSIRLESWVYKLPRFASDLNAMREAERCLRDDEWDLYGSILHGVIKDHTDETTGCEANWHAEARFRAEAFAKLRGIWKA